MESASWGRAGLAFKPTGVPFSPAAALSWLDGELVSFATVCQFALKRGRADFAVNLATALHRYLEAGHGTEALSLYDCGLQAAHTLADPEAQAHLRTNAGVILRLLGRYTCATAELGQALELCRRNGNRHGQARCLSNLGIMLSPLRLPGWWRV